VSISATYLCGACGAVASTVTLVPPGEPDPRLGPEPPGVPPGVGTIFGSILPGVAQVSIDGGPISVTLATRGPEKVATALASGSAAALFAIDEEFAPFWCPDCRASYCRAHYRTTTLYDDGFFDCIRGVCPKGHARTLED
jgi:hypothetical protein